MRTLLIILLTCCALTTQAAEKSITKNVKSLREFKIETEETAADGKTTKLVINCPDGIFSFDVDLAQSKITTLVFVIKNTKFWEGVDFTPTDKKYHEELKNKKGATIKAEGKDCVITLTGEALDLFKAGGRFQFVNQYRG
jgi:hypothetical protein